MDQDPTKAQCSSDNIKLVSDIMWVSECDIVSCWSLLVFTVCGLVLLQTPAKGSENESGLLEKMMARLEKLEKERRSVALNANELQFSQQLNR